MEKSESMHVLTQIFGDILKLILNEQYQEAIPLANKGILQCRKIEREMKKNEERIKLWSIFQSGI